MLREPLRQKSRIPRGQTLLPQSYPAPIGGWNARDSLASMAPTDAVALQNWFPTPTYCEIRGGHIAWAAGMTGNGKTLATYNPLSGTNKLFVATAAAIYDATSGIVADYLNLTGVADGYASTPDSATINFPGDIDVQVKVALADYTPGSQVTLVAKWLPTGNQKSFAAAIITTGELALFTSSTGANTVQMTSTVPTGLLDGSTKWLRWTLDVDDGAGNRVANFYTSNDGAIWTPLGATVTTAGVTSIFDSTAVLEVGGISNGSSQNPTGSIYRARVYNGIAGTLVADMNPAIAHAGDATFTGGAGETWTVNGVAAMIGVRAATVTNGKFQWVNFGDGTNNYLIMCNGADKPQYYNGTTWVAVDGASVPALTGVTTTNLIAPFVSKGRLYFIEKNTLKFWYLAAGAAGGALTAFDLSSVAKMGGYLMAGATWTVDAGDGPDDRVAFVTSEGEVIVYQGTNPSSAASWTLVGVYFTGRPLGRRCFQKYGGDLVLITENGTFPLSAAIQSNAIDFKQALSFKIENAFTAAARSYGSTFGWCVTVMPAREALIVNVPMAEDGKHQQYVMNTITKAWCNFDGWDAEDFTVMNGELYFTKLTSVYKAWSGQADLGANIIAYGKMAFSYFKRPGALKTVKLFRPILAVNGPLSFQIDVDVDFQDRAISGSTTYSSGTAALWGSATWGTSLWGSSQFPVQQWATPAQFPGKAIAGKIQVATKSLIVQWMASEYLYELGGSQ